MKGLVPTEMHKYNRSITLSDLSFSCSGQRGEDWPGFLILIN